MADVKVPDAKIAVLNPAAVTPVIGTPYPAPCSKLYSLVDHGKQNGRVFTSPAAVRSRWPRELPGRRPLVTVAPFLQRGT